MRLPPKQRPMMSGDGGTAGNVRKVLQRAGQLLTLWVGRWQLDVKILMPVKSVTWLCG